MFGANSYYNNPYAVQYQQQPQQQSTNSGIIWVQGEPGAKSYLVAPNNSLLLMDSEDDIFYIKSADQTGMPTLRKFKYSEISGMTAAQNTPEMPSTFNPDNYVTRDEFKAEMAKLSASRAKRGTDNGKQSISTDK